MATYRLRDLFPVLPTIRSRYDPLGVVSNQFHTSPTASNTSKADLAALACLMAAQTGSTCGKGPKALNALC
jgi:hypothetical protein